jgi:hypothetical protein
MKQIKHVSLMLILVSLATGCAGNYGILKRKTGSDAKATKQKLIDNWSDYDIQYRHAVIVFTPINDDRKILLGGNHARREGL